MKRSLRPLRQHNRDPAAVLDVVDHLTQFFGAQRAGHLSEDRPARLLAGFPCSAAQFLDRGGALARLPPDHRILRLPWDDSVGACFRQRFDRPLEALALDQRLNYRNLRLRRLELDALLDPDPQLVLAVYIDNRPLHRVACSIAEPDRLAGADSADFDDMPALAALQRHLARAGPAVRAQRTSLPLRSRVNTAAR